MDDNGSSNWKNLAIVGGLTAGAVGLGYYIYGRWVYDKPCNGELVLASNAPDLLKLWRYYQWFGECDQATFKSMLQQPVRRFIVRQLVSSLRAVSGKISSEEEIDLSRSQLVVEHPWVSKFLEELSNSLEDRVDIQIPDHFIQQVFRLFDANRDGKISKQEFVTKCNMLLTEGHEQRLAALFNLFDEDRNGRITVDEVQRMASDVAELVHDTSPELFNKLGDLIVELLVQHIYAQLKIPQGRVIPSDVMQSFLQGLRKSIPSNAFTSLVEGVVKSSELDGDALFRRYAVQIGDSEELGIAPNFFEKLVEDLLDLDGLFKKMDTLFPVPASTDPRSQKELDELRTVLRHRFEGKSISVSDLLFRALDLDNNGFISKSELEGLVELLKSSPIAANENLNNLEQSYAGVVMAQMRVESENEVQYVMHVLEKKRRVTAERLQAFLRAVIGFITSFILEYIDVHTRSEAREGPLRRIVQVWFYNISKNSDVMDTRVFSRHLGEHIVSLFEASI